MKKEGKGRAAELLHLTVRILTLPPIVIRDAGDAVRAGRREGQRSRALVYGVW